MLKKRWRVVQQVIEPGVMNIPDVELKRFYSKTIARRWMYRRIMHSTVNSPIVSVSPSPAGDELVVIGNLHLERDKAKLVVENNAGYHHRYLRILAA